MSRYDRAIHLHQHPSGLSPTIGILACLLAFATGPVFLTGCSAEAFPDEGTVETVIDIHRSICSLTKAGDGGPGIRHLDIFVFNDDGPGRLDSYTRIDYHPGMTLKASSKSGDKRLVIIANSDISSNLFVETVCYDDISDYAVELGREDVEAPVMSGECRYSAADGAKCDITLTPLLSKIVIKSIVADGLKNISVYLTDVCGRMKILDSMNKWPAEISPHGDSKVYHPGVVLYCYPNNVAEESIGSPMTRLVIEGERDGETVRYSTLIDGKRGIDRNVMYLLNLKILKNGRQETVEKGSMAVFPGNFIVTGTGETVHVWVETYPEDAVVSFDEEDLEMDRSYGIYDYEYDENGRGVYLKMRRGGTGLFIVRAGPPVDETALVLVVSDP